MRRVKNRVVMERGQNGDDWWDWKRTETGMKRVGNGRNRRRKARNSYRLWLTAIEKEPETETDTIYQDGNVT